MSPLSSLIKGTCLLGSATSRVPARTAKMFERMRKPAYELQCCILRRCYNLLVNLLVDPGIGSRGLWQSFGKPQGNLLVCALDSI